MIKALIIWVVAFAVGMVAARGLAWQIAFQMTVPFQAYDVEAIYERVKGRVFSRTWLVANIAGCSLIALAMLLKEEWALILIPVGVLTIVIVGAIQGFKLFKVALREMGCPWPPETNT